MTKYVFPRATFEALITQPIMKPFFKSFFTILFPLLLFVEVFTFILPEDIPYGLFVVSRWVLTLIGTILVITRLKKKHNLAHFGKSFLAGSTVILAVFIIIVMIFSMRFEAYYRYSFNETVLVLAGYMLGQVFLLLSTLLMAGKWYAIEKAGKPGYSMLIPIYNTIVLLKIAHKPVWWIFLFLIPIVNIVHMIKMLNGISKQFGKSEGFTIGLFFLGGIFWAVLGYDTDTEYQGEIYEIVDPELPD